ncbi:MAG: helix-turn-helix domain-containing protein [Oscillospiraceae bacterium]
MSELYNRIEELCKQNKISITAMCKNAGVSRGSLTDLKSGRKKSLSTETISKIADYFSVPMDYLVRKNIMVEAHNEPIYLDDETRDIIDELRTRPEMKILFSVSRNVTKEDIEATVEILKRMQKDSE